MISMYRALVKRRDNSEEPRPVTMGGMAFTATHTEMLQYVMQMEQAFPNNQYFIEKVATEMEDNHAVV